MKTTEDPRPPRSYGRASTARPGRHCLATHHILSTNKRSISGRQKRCCSAPPHSCRIAQTADSCSHPPSAMSALYAYINESPSLCVRVKHITATSIQQIQGLASISVCLLRDCLQHLLARHSLFSHIRPSLTPLARKNSSTVRALCRTLSRSSISNPFIAMTRQRDSKA